MALHIYNFLQLKSGKWHMSYDKDSSRFIRLSDISLALLQTDVYNTVFFNTSIRIKDACQKLITTNSIQWNLSKEDTLGANIFVRFRQVSALDRLVL